MDIFSFIFSRVYSFSRSFFKLYFCLIRLFGWFLVKFFFMFSHWCLVRCAMSATTAPTWPTFACRGPPTWPSTGATSSTEGWWRWGSRWTSPTVGGSPRVPWLPTLAQLCSNRLLLRLRRFLISVMDSSDRWNLEFLPWRWGHRGRRAPWWRFRRNSSRGLLCCRILVKALVSLITTVRISLGNHFFVSLTSWVKPINTSWHLPSPSQWWNGRMNSKITEKERKFQGDPQNCEAVKVSNRLLFPEKGYDMQLQHQKVVHLVANPLFGTQVRLWFFRQQSILMSFTGKGQNFKKKRTAFVVKSLECALFLFVN